MDIQNENDLDIFVGDAYRRYREDYLLPSSYPPLILHDYLIENPIVHDNYVIADVYREFKTLTI